MKTIKNLRTIRIILSVLLLGITSAMAQSQSASLPGTKRTDLQRHDLSIRGHETVQARIDFEPGAAAGYHTHPGEEVIYVLEGEIEYQISGQQPVTLKAGDVLFIPSGAAHRAKNVGRTKASELATYIVEKGKPLLVPQKM